MSFIIASFFIVAGCTTSDVVIHINSYTVRSEAYGKKYNREIRKYFQKYGVKDDNLSLIISFIGSKNLRCMIRNEIIEQLILNGLWLDAARNRGLMVSDDELRNNIMNLKAFQMEGKFDRTLYDRILATNKVSPEEFEEELRQSLIIDKIKNHITDSIHSSVERDDVIKDYTDSMRAKAQIKLNEYFIQDIESASLKDFVKANPKDFLYDLYMKEVDKRLSCQ